MLSINGKTRSRRSTILLVVEMSIDLKKKAQHLEDKMWRSTWRRLSSVGAAAAKLTGPAGDSESEAWSGRLWPDLQNQPLGIRHLDPWQLDRPAGRAGSCQWGRARYDRLGAASESRNRRTDRCAKLCSLP